MTLEGMPHTTRILAVYLNVAYYVLLSPIRISYHKPSGMATGTKCKGVHKLLYIFMSTVPQMVLMCNMFLSDVIETEAGEKVTGRTDEAIYSMSNLCWFSLVAVIKLELWFANNKVANMFNNLMEVERRLNVLPARLWLFKPTVLVSLIYVFMVLTSTIDNMELVSSIRESWSVKNLLICFTAPWETQVSEFGNKFLIILCGIFLIFAKALKERVKTSNDNEISNLLTLMMKASLSIKECFGLTFVASCFTLLPYFAHRLKNLFGNSLFEQYLYFHYMTSLVVLLYLGAEVNSKLHSSLPSYELKQSSCLLTFTTSSGNNGMGKNEGLQRRKLLLLDAISREALGLGGRCMTLNYSFFSSIMATILAYSISIIQFQSNGNITEFSYESKATGVTLSTELHNKSQDTWCASHCRDYFQQNL